jgi:hypothetical protein
MFVLADFDGHLPYYLKDYSIWAMPKRHIAFSFVPVALVSSGEATEGCELIFG